MGRLVKGSGAAGALDPDAERRGYQAGLAAGREAALAEATALLASARAEAEEARQQARDAAVVLARRMAAKIVGHAVEVAPEVMGEIAAQALAASRAKAGAVVLRVHPEDLAAVEASRARWGHGALVVQVVADGGVGRHGCVVETPAGRVDARLASQLAALEQALLRGRT
ncbi:MAG TPA: FliH/SctL family protein [Polyangia bacterium]|nr:FliH/SctL family protein [Polyangia bacterium]